MKTRPTSLVDGKSFSWQPRIFRVIDLLDSVAYSEPCGADVQLAKTALSSARLSHVDTVCAQCNVLPPLWCMPPDHDPSPNTRRSAAAGVTTKLSEIDAHAMCGVQIHAAGWPYDVKLQRRKWLFMRRGMAVPASGQTQEPQFMHCSGRTNRGILFSEEPRFFALHAA